MFEAKTRKYNGIYRGKIIDNVDPLQYGRCKIQFYPMFASLTVSTDLPWAVPAMPLFEGAESGIGSFVVPDIGSFIFGFFEEGDVYQPVYFAEAQTAQKGLPTERVTNYPNRKVWKTSSGILIYIDDTVKEIKIVHPTGTYVLFDEVGNITLDPNSTHRIIINAFARTVESKSGGALNGDDGGLITFSGAVTFTLPSCTDYPGLEYIFKRMDSGVSPATVASNIEPNPLDYRQITGLYATLHLISGGLVTGMWHVI